MHQEHSRYTGKPFTNRVERLSLEISKRLKKGIEGRDDKEFLVTNGIGGYSSLTLLNNQRRKFHGLLVAALNPPINRWVLVANVREFLLKSNREIDLSRCRKTFMYDLLPEQIYHIDGLNLKRIIFMPHEENTTILFYACDAKEEVDFVFSPVLAFRHFYDVQTDRKEFKIEEKEGEVIYRSRNVKLRVIAPFSNFTKETGWMKVRYDVDKIRGEEHEEILFIGGKFHIKRNAFPIIFTTEEKNYDAMRELEVEMRRRRGIIRKSSLRFLPKQLILATDSFLVKRDGMRSLIAGYHWFGEWSRDAMVSLPGLLLVTKRFREAREVILNFLRWEQVGLIPNAILDRDGSVIYNSVDAPLWVIDRVMQYLKYTRDLPFLRNVWEKLEPIIQNFYSGTLFGIHMDEDFLLHHGKGLTWMDTRLTPRSGKAVEVQALWYNALRIMHIFSRLIGKKTMNYLDIATCLKKNFLESYKGLYDVIDKRDASLRPNVLFAISLDFPLIEGNLAKEILTKVEENLATPFGLRTLDKKNALYKGSLIGNYDKDDAYHNGAIWPWLLGSFIRGYLKVNGYSGRNRAYLFENYVKNLLFTLTEGCIGSINEIFDGDEPFLPRGCISQAWSVAELIRATVEDILYIRPPYEEKILE